MTSWCLKVSSKWVEVGSRWLSGSRNGLYSSRLSGGQTVLHPREGVLQKDTDHHSNIQDVF